MDRPEPAARRLTAPGRIAVVALVGLIGLWTTASLGFWQLRRAAVKEELQQRIEAAASAVATRPTAADLARPDALVDRHVALEGRWLPDRAVYLDNRPRIGQAGLFVLMPLRIDAPVRADVIVNRGWIPRNGEDRSRIARYVTPDGPVRVAGLVLAEEPKLLELAAPPERRLQGIWQNFDFAAYAKASGQPALPIVVREDPPATAQPGPASDDGLSRDWPDRAGVLQGQIDRHHGYAFQWFALTATLAALLALQFVRSIRHVRPFPR